MRGATNIIMAAAALAAVAGVGAPNARAQATGDEKCSPDGYVMTYYAALKIWQKSAINRCEAGGASSHRGDDNDRRSRRRDDDREDSGAATGGRPEDGDEKCGPDGYILKYDYNDYLNKGAWRETVRRCRR